MISKKFLDFFKKIGVNPQSGISIVPKSESCAYPGEIVLFRYILDRKRQLRLFLVVEPVVKSAKTGNLLLTGFKVSPEDDFDREKILSLYKNKALPKDSYRTYILSKIYGPLYKINL